MLLMEGLHFCNLIQRKRSCRRMLCISAMLCVCFEFVQYRAYFSAAQHCCAAPVVMCGCCVVLWCDYLLSSLLWVVRGGPHHYTVSSM